MEDKPTSPVDNPIQTSGEIEPNVDKNVVAYDTHKKLLGEKKKMQARLESMESSLSEFQVAKAEAEGQKDEANKLLRQRLTETEAKLKETRETYTWNKVSNAIKDVAGKHGCIISDRFINLLSEQDVNGIEMDNYGNVDMQSVEYVVEQAKKDNPRLFHSKEVRFSDGTPQKQFIQTEKQLSATSDMGDLEEAYKKAHGIG